METLKHCTIENLGKKHLDFWWKLKNDSRLKRCYWGNPWEVYSRRVLELEIEKNLKSKELRRIAQYVVKDASGEPIAALVLRRNIWNNAPASSFGLVKVFPVDDAKLEEKALNESFRWLQEMCFLSYRLDVLCAEPIEDNSAYIAFLEKYGFKRQGILRNCFMDKGIFLGRVTMDLLQEEWKAMR
jgi:RimJ/RimL family protein N-acetyltransferase